MPESHYGALTIGGEIKSSVLPSLTEILTKAGYNTISLRDVAHNHTAFVDFPLKAEQLQGHFLLLEDDQAPAGTFPVLEMFLAEHNISFDRYASEHDDYEAERLCFRKGWDESVSHLESVTGGVVIDSHTLQEILIAIDGALPQRKLEDLRERLRKLAPEVEELTVINATEKE